MSALFIPGPGTAGEHETRRLIDAWWKVGNEVRLNTNKSGIVIGFGEKHIHRGSLRHKYSGCYIDFEKLFVAPTDGSPRTLISAWSLTNMSLEVEVPSRVFIRIGDLPETPFWEGDIVAFRDKVVMKSDGGHVQNYDCHTVVSHKYLQDGGIECWIATPERVEIRVGSPDDLVLMSRGNLWKLDHGEPMIFASIEEETKFYQSIGMSQKLTHPSELPPWTSEEFGMETALSIVRRGFADEIKLKDKKLMTFVVIKYDNEELGKRIRALTLAKFGLGEDVSE